jgi:hypothetical protein
LTLYRCFAAGNGVPKNLTNDLFGFFVVEMAFRTSSRSDSRLRQIQWWAASFLYVGQIVGHLLCHSIAFFVIDYPNKKGINPVRIGFMPSFAIHCL